MSRRRARRNKKLKKILLVASLPLLLAFSVVGVMISNSSSLPAIADNMLVNYKAAAEFAGCTWQDLLVYDTVRSENEFDGIDPFVSAVDFIKLHYEKWIWIASKEGDGYWQKKESKDYTTTTLIYSFFRLDAESDIQAVLDAAKARVEETDTYAKYVIEFTSKDLENLIIEKGFNEEQIEWIDLLISEGLLDEMFGGLYDLPDYIEDAAGGYFAWPTPKLHSVTSKFASVRVHPVLGMKRAHNGVDISGSNAMGSPVIAIEGGTVIYVDMAGGERGINIKVQHKIGDDVWISRYQHLSAVKAAVGDEVTRGTVIGAVGNTGIGTGAHLHIELIYNGVLIDPLPLIQD